jgi:hypothetical protein
VSVTTVERHLSKNDRCDSCSAAAQVVVTFLNGDLMFCGHHANKLKTSLLDKSISVWDPNNLMF